MSAAAAAAFFFLTTGGKVYARMLYIHLSVFFFPIPTWLLPKIKPRHKEEVARVGRDLGSGSESVGNTSSPVSWPKSLLSIKVYRYLVFIRRVFVPGTTFYVVWGIGGGWVVRRTWYNVARIRIWHE